MSTIFSETRWLVALLLLFLVNPQIISAQTITASVGFEYGFIGEYNNNAHQPERGVLLSTLGVEQVVISQDTDDGTFGGSQGNDYDVQVTFLFTDGTQKTFTAAVNWRDTDGGTNIGIGLIGDVANPDDGTSYTAGTGLAKSYLLRFVGQTRTYSETSVDTLVPEVSGNAANKGAMAALNSYRTASPASSVASPLQSTLQASPSAILANATSTSTVTVTLYDVNGNQLTSGGDTVELSTDKGTLSAVTDNGDGTYTATLTSSNTVETATITGSVNGDSISGSATVDFLGSDGSPPVITGPSSSTGSTASKTIYENTTSVHSFTADEAVTWSIVSGNDSGEFSIGSSSGALIFDTAPDFENPTAVGGGNNYVVTVRATDPSGNMTNQTVTVTVANVTSSLSGTVRDSSNALASGVTVRLRNASNVVVATTSTVSGAYTFSEVVPATYAVEFIPSSGAARGKSNRGTVNGRFVESITVADGDNFSDVDGILIDPAGVVYDSATRNPVSGATVRLYVDPVGSDTRREVLNSELDVTLGGLSGQVTAADGQYTFILNGSAPDGTYDIVVTPPATHVFESVDISPTAGPLNPGLGGGIYAVQTQSTAPSTGQDTTYYLSFSFEFGDTLETSSNGVINNHIPLDPVSPELTVTKTADNTSLGSPSIGDTINYTITVENSGNVTFTGVTLTDDLTADEAWDSTDGDAPDGSGSLDVGETWTYTASYTLTQSDLDAGSVENVAYATGTPSTGSNVTAYSAANGVASTASSAPASGGGVVTTLTVSPELTVTKTVDESSLEDGVRSGDQLLYTIVITNTGNVTLSNVSLTDTISLVGGGAVTLDAEPTKASDTGSVTSDTIMDPGDVWTFTASYTLTSQAIASGGVENIALVSGQAPSGSTISAESKVGGNTSNGGVGEPTGTEFPGELSGVVKEYQAGVAGVVVRLLNETSPGNYTYVNDPDNPSQHLTEVTNSYGEYTFLGLEPGVYALEFDAPTGTSDPTASSAKFSESGNRILNVNLGAGAVEVEQNAFFIDPSGIVYDAETFTPIAGATVTLYYQASSDAEPNLVPNSWFDTTIGDANSHVTSSDGMYTFLLQPSTAQDGIYSLVVEKSGYKFTSTVFPATNGPFDAGLGGGLVEVNSQAVPVEGMDPTYYLSFAMAFGPTPATSSNGSVNNHIPLDADLIVSIEQDLKDILKDDLAATMQQQEQQISRYADRALERLRERTPNSCARELNALVAADPIQFAEASSKLAPESRATLELVSELIARCPEQIFEVGGHTDSQAEAEYNLALSYSRANAVISELVSLGAPRDALVANGYGETSPVADNSSEIGRQQNRRVVFTFIGPRDEEVACRNRFSADQRLNMNVTESDLRLDGSLYSEAHDCSRDLLRITEASTGYLTTDTGTRQWMFNISRRSERFVDAYNVRGQFMGLYGSRNDVSTLASGSIQGLGVNAGIYGAHAFETGLFLDYYIAAAAGRHNFDLSFARAGGAIAADGHYTYAAAFLGAAISGESSLGNYSITPRSGFNASWSPGAEADYVASRGALSQLGSLSTGDIQGRRIFAEVGLSNILRDGPVELSITPGLFCNRPIALSNSECGSSLSVNIIGNHDDTGVNYELELYSESSSYHRAVGLTGSYIQPLFNGELSASGTFQRGGNLVLGARYNFDF